MDIRILSPEDIEFKEKDVQRAFENDLSKLYEGLELVDSEVTIPVGRIDTLAFDTNTNQPVFIEYKAGEFGRDALIQLMDYISWFIRDRSHHDTLKRIIRQKKQSIEDIEQDIRLICVVTGIEERIGNAIYAIANDVLVYSYAVAKDTAGNAVLIPKLEVDNTDVDRVPQPSVTEDELSKKFPKQVELFAVLKEELLKNNAQSYIRGRTFRFRKNRVFAQVLLKQDVTRLKLRAGVGNINDPEFKYYKKGTSDWGIVILRPADGLPEKVKGWIEIARELTPNKAEDEGEDEIDKEDAG